MSLHLWLLYAATVFVISALPGPNMLLVMSHGALYGWRRSTPTMLGCLTALLMMISVSVGGLGLFFAAWPKLFDGIRVLGAIYLFYLGWKSWRTRRCRDNALHSASGDGRKDRPLNRFLTGFWVSASNPKALLFTVALVPQFMRSQAPVQGQFWELVLTFTVIEFSWYSTYSAFGARLARWLRGARSTLYLRAGTGLLFMALGTTLWILALLQLLHR
ncbi:LysE family translocator [Acidithiobacillus sp. IBUN Pt1247-S3]|uniref:LysE family translocator n=1 Tax=Acidithiobacillus sp. IBUN Pt1247-S3 TaxID=3166642 RepID=UPI0034E4B26A